MAVLAENFSLRRFVEIGADLQCMAGGEAEAPAYPWIAAGDFHHSLEEGADIEFITAETSWLQAAVKSGFDEFVMQGL